MPVFDVNPSSTSSFSGGGECCSAAHAVPAGDTAACSPSRASGGGEVVLTRKNFGEESEEDSDGESIGDVVGVRLILA